MPTIMIFKSIKILIYFNDHTPAHIHAVKDGAEAKVNLEDCKCFYARGFSSKAVKRIEQFVEENKDFLLETWRDYHE